MGEHVRAMADLRSPGVLDSPEDLIRLALAGDEAAFARIVRLHRADMVRACYVVAGDLDLALEGVNAAWPVAWARLRSLADPARLGPWLCAIAAAETRAVVRYWSSRDAQEFRAEVYGSGPLAGPGPRARAVRPASDQELADQLHGLSLEDRAVLALDQIAGLTPGELADATRMAPRAAASRRRAIARRVSRNLARQPLDAAAATRVLGMRLRAYADVPVAHVDIDAVARVAKLTRHDRRYRLVSLVIAAVLALAATSIPYLGESGRWSTLARNAAPPTPMPTLQAPRASDSLSPGAPIR
jgi:DNA-directed RNA polymerase specialized sigma24 family protein